MAQITEEEAQRRLLLLGETFTPSAPIDDQDLFAGRNHELFSVVEAMQSAGQHAVIYGERGVGKTSLARVAMLVSRSIQHVSVRVNCDGADGFADLWRKVVDELRIYIGEAPETEREQVAEPIDQCAEILSAADLNPSVVRVGLRKVSQVRPLCIFFDEFNEVMDSNAISLLSNTIKSLSDHIEKVTLCPVAVAESLDALLEGHLSAVRAIVQVKMPRMQRDELEDIVRRGLDRLKMTMDDDALHLVRVIPRGLPQYAHLLAQEGARQALLRQEDAITRENVMVGLRIGLSKLDHSLSKAYEEATYSPRKTRLREVLLACAVAKLGDMGDFSPSDIRQSYSKIIGEEVGIDRFNPQLTSLATQRDILLREGDDRRWRYRFKDPLMEPFVLLNGLSTGAITPDDFPH